MSTQSRLWIRTLLALSLALAYNAVDVSGAIGPIYRTKVIAVHRRPRASASYQMEVADQEGQTALIPPLMGFSPLVAVVTSDRHSSTDFDFEHRLAASYEGSPLNPPAQENFTVGVLDTGAQVHLVFDEAAKVLGIVGPYLSPNTFPIGGIGGMADAQITMPMGLFAAGLGRVDPVGGLDLSAVVGHTNVCMLVSPALQCDAGASALVGMPLLAFYTSIIRQDRHARITLADRLYVSPEVQLQQGWEGDPQGFPHSIPIELGGLAPVTTASYYGFPDFDDFFGPIEPLTPTLLSMFALSFPTGGAFFTELGILQGRPGPLNSIRYIQVMLDTGAQISLLSPTVAAKLSLPIEPDFMVLACGIGGTIEVPGYYIDYVKLDALGGALEFAKVPFAVIDLESPAGGSLDGVLGMNIFWNRNIVIEPLRTGAGFIHVSRPINYAYIDLNDDGKVDLNDFAVLGHSWRSTGGDQYWNPACDLFADELIDSQDLAAFADAWGSPGRP